MSIPGNIVLGTAALGGVWGPVEREESIATILLALERGIFAIDTAPAYGHAEEYVGQAIREWRGQPPLISTKVGRLQSFSATAGVYDYRGDAMNRSVGESLTRIGVSAVDILFLHDPQAIDPLDADRIVGAMLAFKEKGFTRRIGIGGNPAPWCRRFLDQGLFDVVMEYNKLNACNTEAVNDTLSYCLQKGIGYFAASPLNMGLLGRHFEEQVLHPPSWISEQTCETAKQIKYLADSVDLSLTEMAHRFLISLPYPFHLVIGAANRKELNETLRQLSNGPLQSSLITELLKYSTNKSPSDVQD